MKRSGQNRDRIEAMALRLEESIQKLESEQFQREEAFQQIYADSAELLGLSRQGPAYIRERARRLNDLLQRAHRETGYRSDRFQLLFRQIDKIRDPLISDFFSPALQARIDRLAAGGRDAVERPRAPLLFQLGEFTFLLRAPIRQILRGVRPEDRPRWKTPGSRLEIFPRENDAFFAGMRHGRALDLLVVPCAAEDEFLGLWFTSSLPVSAAQAERMAHNQSPLASSHRFISGRTRFAGKTVYLIETT